MVTTLYTYLSLPFREAVEVQSSCAPCTVSEQTVTAQARNGIHLRWAAALAFATFSQSSLGARCSKGRFICWRSSVILRQIITSLLLYRFYTLSHIPDSFSFLELSVKPLDNIPLNMFCASDSHIFVLPQFFSDKNRRENCLESFYEGQAAHVTPAAALLGQLQFCRRRLFKQSS